MSELIPMPNPTMRPSLDCHRTCPSADNDRIGWVRCCIDWKFRVGPSFVLQCPHAERWEREQSAEGTSR